MVFDYVDINVTCEAPSPGLRTTKGTTTTTTTTTTATTTTTQPLTTTSTPPTVSPAVPPADVICGCCKCNDPAFPLAAVIVPIVVSVLVVALGTAVNIILYRRRITLVNEPKPGGMTSTDPVHYDSLDQSRVELPNTYEEISTRQTYVNMAVDT
ncbi:uncharacterized protein LOC117321114 [Pecten maximus]|uniref:uncharacterized protein LOC117321114 n=1 Tax=Pecten maximus TaxID=6579 RepID=UPI0014580AD1|nr:uncharacterized protein LOC117321114 [Pecten maximus]